MKQTKLIIANATVADQCPSFITFAAMKNFDEKEKQIQEICDTIRTAGRLDLQLKLAFYDILDLVRKAYYEGHDAGVQTMSDIQLKNQEKINDIFKQYLK